MARREGMTEKKCGCIVFEYGPPVPCEHHQRKAEKKEARDKAREEKGLRKIVAQQASDNGHDLSRFKEYPSRPGKWTAHCHRCGSIIIVYDVVPEFGDQISGKAIFAPCEESALVGTLRDAERQALADRFARAEAEDEPASTDDTVDHPAT